MSRDHQSFWLTMCVLLAYQHLAEVICEDACIRDSANVYLRFFPKPQEMTLVIDSGIETKIQKGPDPNDPKCADWEVFDGVDCVCANDTNARCNDKGGMVCDNSGSRYKSACVYALKICQGKIPVERKIETCGTCNNLQLVSGKDGHVIVKFSRTGSHSDGTAAEYTSQRGGLLVFYAKELTAWAVGKRSKNATFIAMRQIDNSTYPQDNKGGMLVATQQGGETDWELDPFMHFECVQNVTKRDRQKRFFFVAFVFVGLAATATTTTLKVVQAKKGCLYYPSVCKLRDRIKDHLKPEVTRLRNRFVSTYGDPGKFKEVADKIHDQTLDVRDKITTVKELHTQLKLYLSELTGVAGSIQDEFPDIKNTLVNYYGWVKNLNKVAAINILMLQFEVALTLPGLLAASVGSFALAAAGIGALFAVGFAVVDVISSVKEEKKVRDELKDTEAKYLKAKSDLESAFANIRQFQTKFCSSVLAFYRDLSKKGRTYHSTFQSLYTFVSDVYGKSVSDCTTRYSRSNLATLSKLSDQKLQPLINFLEKDIDKLHRKIAEVKETNAFLSQIISMVKTNLQSPSTIFRAVKLIKPKFMSNTFSTLWELLVFIAEQVLPRRSCFWGHNLSEIRAGTITKFNYTQASICNSTEMKTDIEKIQLGVSKGFAPCKIFRLVEGPVFKSRYNVIKFLADHVLERASCYWGYDLAKVRSKQLDVREVDTALVNPGLFQTIDYFRASIIGTGEISTARNILCQVHAVCTSSWQTFILCHTWKGHDVVNFLGCSLTANSETSSVCVPGKQHFETCN